jgi:hypothetical protein
MNGVHCIDSLGFERHGDKENSLFFEDYLVRLLEERDNMGLTAMIHEIDALMITVDPGHSIQYIGELTLMTPYHYLVTLESESHWTHVLRIDLNSPDILLREVKDPNLRGIFRSLNEVYPVGAKKPNSRYMGEIIRVSNLHDVVKLQQEREFRFFSQDDVRKLEFPGNVAVSKPSPYTHNVVGYLERKPDELRVYSLGVSVIHPEVQAAYDAAKSSGNSRLQPKSRSGDIGISLAFQLLLLGCLQYQGSKLIHQCHQVRAWPARIQESGQSLYCQQHTIFRQSSGASAVAH